MTPDLSLMHETGGGGGFPGPPRVGLGRPVVAAAAGTAGCATKGDIRDVRADLTRLEAQQDSILRILQVQNREILDSLQVTTERLMNVRGELANQLSQLNDELSQVAQLTGQVQVRLNQFDQQLASAIEQIQQVRAVGAQPSGDPAGSDNTFDMAAEFYTIGLEQKDRGNARTARQAFQAVVDSFPDHPTAAQALFQVGETHVMEGAFSQALQAFDGVVRRYQNSDTAPRALYRAGVIAEQQGNRDQAREYFRRVVSGYPNSDARRLAETALERLSGG